MHGPHWVLSLFYVDSDYICNSVELEQFTAARRSAFSQLPVTNVDGKTSKSIRHSPAWRGSSVGAWRMLAKPANEEIRISIVLQQSEILLIFFFSDYNHFFGFGSA